MTIKVTIAMQQACVDIDSHCHLSCNRRQCEPLLDVLASAIQVVIRYDHYEKKILPYSCDLFRSSLVARNVNIQVEKKNKKTMQSISINVPALEKW